jgi:hypothetical protein
LHVSQPELVEACDDELLLLGHRDHLGASKEGLLSVDLVVDSHLGELVVFVSRLKDQVLVKVEVVHLKVLCQNDQQEGAVKRQVLIFLLKLLGYLLSGEL